MKRLMLAALLALATPAVAVHAQSVSVDTPLHFKRQFSGDQRLRFKAGGYAIHPKKARLSYRVIASRADWKKTWGYLYDNTLDVDFTKYRVLAVYKSPASGGFRFIPKRVYLLEKKLSLSVDVLWDGKTGSGHPFLFLVVDKFKTLDVEETFLGPSAKKVRYP